MSAPDIIKAGIRDAASEMSGKQLNKERGGETDICRDSKLKIDTFLPN